jgi:hypothetical protein
MWEDCTPGGKMKLEGGGGEERERERFKEAGDKELVGNSHNPRRVGEIPAGSQDSLRVVEVMMMMMMTMMTTH